MEPTTVNTLIIQTYAVIISLFLGSFYNVIAIRLLKKESFVYPPSHCPTCNHRLGVFDLIPIFSYLFLGGKCRYCKTKISPLYPIGEAVSGLVLYSLFWKAGLTWELLPAFLFGTALLLATWTDIRERLILDKVTYPLLVVIGVARYFIGDYPFLSYLSGAVVMFLMLWMVSYLSKGGIGGGDIKLYALVGMTLGLQGACFSLLIACAVGVLISLPIVWKKGRKTEIPFAPFILIGSMIVYLFSSYFPLY